MTEAKSKEMRDIRSDLQDRADLLRQQLRTEQAQFELLVAQLRREQSNRIDDLRTQFEAATKLLQVANWYYNVRMAAARSLALAAAAEIAAHQFFDAQNCSIFGSASERQVETNSDRRPS